uniref:Fanconi anemia group M protein-like n=1 Tax=Saccoglossus kowalevskii TaxID=10224 RepID=A0ABM0M9M2_SACKO
MSATYNHWDQNENNTKQKNRNSEVIRGFLDEEAEVSDDISQYSSDENINEGYDTSMEEFINDATQASQQQTDLQHMYLQSLHQKRMESPAVHAYKNKYKMIYNDHSDHDDIFSQVPQQDHTYEEDSFVVDEVTNSCLDDEFNYTINPANILHGKRNTRCRPALPNIKDTGIEAERSRKPKRRRIILQDSSSDEDVVVPNMLKSCTSNKSVFATPKVTPQLQRFASHTAVHKRNQINSGVITGDVRIMSSKSASLKPGMNDVHLTKEQFEREERLKRQKEKQMQFKKIAEEKRKLGQMTNVSPPGAVQLEQTFTNANFDLMPQYLSNKESEKLTVLVDSREIGSSNIASRLRIIYNMNIHVHQLKGCDYIISRRMGVERRTMSDFASSVNRTALLERIRHLCDLYDKPCLIIEKDRMKAHEDKPKQ